MTKYWLIAVASLFIIGSFSVAMHTTLVQASDSPPPRRPLSNTIPFDRAVLATPSGILTEKRAALAEKRDKTKMKLIDLKLQRCEKLSKNITARSKKHLEKITEMEKKLTSIANGIKEFYVQKNLNLSNYSTLVTAIDIKAAALEPLLATATSDVAAFSCTGDGPHEQLKLIDTDIRAVLKGLQDYRTEIHALIKAIKETPVDGATAVPTIAQ